MAKISDQSKNQNGGAQPPAQRNDWGFPEVTEPRCSICQSDVRRDVDRLLALGLSSGKIAESFELMGKKFSRQAIWNHGKKHMTLHTSTVRGIIEKRAKERMMDIEEHEGFLLTRESLTEIATHQGFLAMMAEKMDWSPKDLLAWMEKLEAMERADYDESLEQLQLQFDCLVQAVKSVVPESYWERIYENWGKLLRGQEPRVNALPAGEIVVPESEVTEDE